MPPSRAHSVHGVTYRPLRSRAVVVRHVSPYRARPSRAVSAAGATCRRIRLRSKWCNGRAAVAELHEIEATRAWAESAAAIDGLTSDEVFAKGSLAVQVMMQWLEACHLTRKVARVAAARKGAEAGGDVFVPEDDLCGAVTQGDGLMQAKARRALKRAKG